MSTPDAFYKAQRGLWQRLRTRLAEGDHTPQALDRAIIEVTALYEHDYAKAGALRSGLIAAGGVLVTKGDDGPRYRVAPTFPAWVDYSPGSEATRAEEHRRYEEELARVERDRQRLYENSAIGVQHRLAEQALEAKLQPLLDRIEELEGTVARLSEQLGPTDPESVTEVAA